MAKVVLVEIGDMRVQAVTIEVDVCLRIARVKPGILDRAGYAVLTRRSLTLARQMNPFVSVVRDGANQLIERDRLFCVGELLGKPILRGNRSGAAAFSAVVLVIVHQNHAVGSV